MRRLIDHRVLRAAAWLTGGELANRVARLVTAVVLARSLGIEMFALAAVLLACFEIVRMLTHNGFGARIVGADDAALPAVTAAVHRANWLLALVMAGLQVGLAVPVARLYGAPDLVAPLAALAGVYLIYPFATVQVFLTQRCGDLRLFAVLGSGQTIVENVLIAVLALGGFGLWSLVLPKFVVAAGWVLVWRRRVAWRATVRTTRAEWRDLLTYGRTVFGAEAVRTLATHCDKLIVGKVLGLEVLGYYAFAVNAGSGVALSLSTAVGNVILPFVAGRLGAPGAAPQARLAAGLKLVALTVLPLLLLQAALAPLYVPLVFGSQWAPAINIVMLACVAASARPFLTAIAQYYRASGRVGEEWRMAWLSNGCLLGGLIAGLPFGLDGAGIGLVVGALLPLPLVFHHAFANHETGPRPHLMGASS